MATTTLLFPWNDTYSVKIGIIDMQHKNLVDMIQTNYTQAMIHAHGQGASRAKSFQPY